MNSRFMWDLSFFHSGLAFMDTGQAASVCIAGVGVHGGIRYNGGDQVYWRGSGIGEGIRYRMGGYQVSWM